MALLAWIRRFYRSKEWKQKREEILSRDNYECQKCKSRGEVNKAECVHHIKHLDKYPELALVDSNLISLCNACHNKEHPEKLKKYRAGEKKYITEEKW